MGKDLVIVESPAKAKTITRILGDSYKIMASIGHVRDLPERSLAIDVENKFKPKYTTTTRGQKVIADLSKAAEGAENIYLATDPDREGEAIAWHLYEALKRKTKTQNFQRVTFHEITRSAVQESFSHPGQINMDRVDAQQARRVVDRLVGYQVSPLLWRRIDNATSAGRVQSVAVRLICEREVEIENFVSEEYWLLSALFKKLDTGEEFTARLGRINGEKPVIGDAETANRYATDAEGASYTVTKVARTPRTKRAAPPFITSTLQQAASSNLRMSPDQTMAVAQQLYEGVDRAEATGGLITYMRTDSVNISKEAQAAARDFIEQTFGKDFVPNKPNNYRSRGGAQEAHEAIRPTDVTLTPDQARKFLDDRQLKLYRLIWNRFVASQMAPAKLSLHQIEMSSDAGTSTETYLFRASSTRVVFPGYMSVYNLEDVDVKDPKKADADDDDEDDTTSLPDLKENDRANLKTLNKEQKFTEPPPRFSEATLVRELERNGVGRPSTYAAIIKKIKDREYVTKEKGKLAPTSVGRQVNDFLITNIPDLFDVKFTARLEDELDVIEQGDLEWVKMLEKFYGRLSKWIEKAKTADSPPDEHVQRILDMFPADTKWSPPEKRGKRTYDDSKFHADMSEQIQKDKRLSARQWNALLVMAVRYEDQLTGKLDEAAKDLKIQDTIKDLRVKQAERAKLETGEPDERALKFCKYFEAVENWEPPEKRGRRTYDDKKFYTSLKEQAERGRQLSDPQMNALKRLVVKYREQIPNFDEISDQLGEAAETAADTGEVEKLLELGSEIENWPEKKGGRYDDKTFYESLERQFKQRRNLTPKQVNALKRLVGKYKEQIKDFDERAKGIDMPKPGERKKAVLTEVDCPKCGKAKLAERSARGRTFYGCSRYPKCKYAADSLEKAAEDAAKGSD